MDPTVADVQSWTCIGEVCDFVELPKEYGVAYENSARGSLLALFGASDEAPWKPFGLIGEDEWASHLANWRVEGSPPSLLHRSMGGALGRACRIGVGTELRREQLRDVQLARDIAMAKAEAEGRAIGDAQVSAAARQGLAAAEPVGSSPGTPRCNPLGGHYPFPGGYVPPARLPALRGLTRARPEGPRG